MKRGRTAPEPLRAVAENATSVSPRSRRSSTPRDALTYAGADVAARRKDAARWLAQGAASGVVVSKLMTKYHVSRRTAESDLGSVRAAFIERIEREMPGRLAMLLTSLDTILNRAIVAENWNAATRAAATIATVCGFNRTNVSIELTKEQQAHLGALRMEPVDKQRAVVGVLAMTPSQRAQRREELLVRRALPEPRDGDSHHENDEPQLTKAPDRNA